MASPGPRGRTALLSAFSTSSSRAWGEDAPLAPTPRRPQPGLEGPGRPPVGVPTSSSRPPQKVPHWMELGMLTQAGRGAQGAVRRHKSLKSLMTTTQGCSPLARAWGEGEAAVRAWGCQAGRTSQRRRQWEDSLTWNHLAWRRAFRSCRHLSGFRMSSGSEQAARDPRRRRDAEPLSSLGPPCTPLQLFVYHLFIKMLVWRQ